MFPEKNMSSCAMKSQESDEEVDLETLRLAALKSRKTKYGSRVNHNNLIPIVPVAFETPGFVETKIKKEKISPTPEDNITEGVTTDSLNKQNEDEKNSQYSESTSENDEDVLSVDDKEEEDSLERLIDQLEAEISENAPLQTNRIVLSSKTSAKEKKEKRKRSKKVKKDADDEIELVQIKTGKEPGAIIEIRESASPENALKDSVSKQNEPFSQEKSLNRRSRSRFRSRSRSPFSSGRTYRRSRSPYWYKSPRRSRSPFRRSRSPFWLSRRSRSSSRKSRSPIRRYKSPIRKRSYSRFSRSRSKSFERRRSPWSSPRRSKSPFYREGSPFYREGSPFFRRRNFHSPSGRGRRSFSPRDGSKSPKRRSRSPRRFLKNSPFRRSKSPFRRSKSPPRRNKSPPRRSKSPFSRRSKSPIGKMAGRRSKTPPRWSLSPEKRQNFPRRRSKSPVKKSEPSRKSPRPRTTKDERNLSFSTSPTPKRNRSPLRVVEKNKPDQNGKNEKPRNRNEQSHRSLSRENNKSYDRRSHRNRYFRRVSPSRNRRSADRQARNSRSPQQNQNVDKPKEGSNQGAKVPEQGSQLPSAPPDPVLEARKKKFENLGEVDPTVDKKISLKSVKESTENVEDDEDALTINLEGNLWEESEESGDECESRFKSGDPKKNRTVLPNRSVLSFRNLREGDAANRKVLLNKPLIEENRREKFGRGDRFERWQGRRNDRHETRGSHQEGRRSRSEASDRNKSQKVSNERHGSQGSSARVEKRSDRKPIVWSSKENKKSEKNSKENEVFKPQQSEVGKEEKIKGPEKKPSETKQRLEKKEMTVQETDDFDKLISDFEKELESDICLSTKVINSTVSTDQNEVKRPKIEVKPPSFSTEIPKSTIPEPTIKKTIGARSVRISEATSNKSDVDLVEETRKFAKGIEKIDLDDVRQDGPEDYIEDDDFVLEVSTRKKKTKVEEEDNQSDLRAVLSRRRNERLTKVVNVQENMPTRLVQSAFQSLGNKKAKRQEKEIQEPVEHQLEKSLKNTGIERRRVLLLHRDKNPSLSSGRSALIVPEVNQETTIFQRFPRSSERRKRKLQRQAQDAVDAEMDQEEEEEGFEIEEEKQSRRFRLKRNITLSSQKQM